VEGEIIMKQRISDQLQHNIDLILSLMGNSSDFIVRELVISGGKHVGLFYLDGMVDMKTLQDNVIASLHDRAANENTTVQQLNESILDAGDVTTVLTLEEAIEQILSGGLLIIMEGMTEGSIVSLPGWEERSISESKSQSTIKGPQDSFTETLRTNTTLVRRRVKDSRVRITTIKVGDKSKTNVSIMYIQGIANEKMVRQTADRLTSIKLDRVLDGQYLEECLLEQKTKTIFPMLFNSDRPDTVAAGITEGKIAIFVDGTPFVLIAPSLFVDFFQSAEDYYQSYAYSSAIRILRYLSLFICMLAPSIYIALTTHHQDMLPTVLLLSLAAQREGVPFPAFIEALIMEIIFEILREAGIRMPRAIGQTVSIVGSIVIGQAAVEAGIVSAVMVIVVAITAISSFVIPSYAMSIAIRLLRFVFMGLAAAFGTYGVTIGFIILVVHLNSLHSFGVPYMSPIAPYNASKQNDAILRFPYRSKKNG
jgi:spore germination protein KA